MVKNNIKTTVAIDGHIMEHFEEALETFDAKNLLNMTKKQVIESCMLFFINYNNRLELDLEKGLKFDFMELTPLRYETETELETEGGLINAIQDFTKERDKKQ